MSQRSGLEITAAPSADPSKPSENVSIQTRVDTGGRTQVRLQVQPDALADPSDSKPPVSTPEPEKKVEAVPAGEPPARPSWLPAKFETPNALKDATVALAKKQGLPGYVIRGIELSESGQEVADAYVSFEKKIDPNAGKPPAAVVPPPGTEAPKPGEEVPPAAAPPAAPVPFVKSDEVKAHERETYGTYVADMLDKAEVSAEAMGEEFAANGNKLTDATYAKFAAAGVAKPFLDAYITGMVGNARTLAENHIKEVKSEIFGGDEGFNTVALWASGNLTADQHALYTKMTNAGDLMMAKEAAKMLKGWHEKAVGVQPKTTVVPNVPNVPENKGYESRQQMIADMNDPRYKSGDKAFHKMVETKLLHTTKL